MNAIRTINLTKQILLISFVFFLSCKKQTEVSSPPQKPLSENAFFSRAKISANQSDRDLVDTIIDFCKRADDISHFSDAVINKYGYPKWDLTMTLQNENGLKTLFVPVVDSADRVRLIISAYQQSKDKFLFKMIAKDMQHPGLPKSSNDNKVFTQQSLAGIFNSFEKRVIELKNIPNSPSSNIETRGLGFTFSWLCWTESWMDETGGFFMTNTKCSYTITFTPDAYGGIASVPDLPEIGGGGSGGGGDFEKHTDPVQEIKNEMKDECLNTVLSEVTDTKLKSLIAVLFNSTFGGTPGNFTIKFSENPNLLTENGLYPDQARGYYIRTQNIWVIEMNPKFASISAKESLAAAMIHEIVHSFIGLYKEFRGGQGSTILNNFQAHTFMYKEWIDKMRDILVEVYDMAPRNAVALSCFGLSDILSKEGVPIKEIDDFLFDKYKVRIKDVNEVGELYEKGTYGEKCK
jgi:hypothetical protein